MFDVEKYAKYMDDFILEMEKSQDMHQPDIQGTLGKICELLRIAKIEVFFYESIGKEKDGLGDSKVFYSTDNMDESRFIQQKELTGGGSVAVYYIFQRKDDESWNDIERERIQVLQKAMFAFQGRMRLLRMIEELTFKDKELNIYNLNYFMKRTGMEMQTGQIEKYAVAYFNLKRFALINQQFGRENGTDIMQRYVAQLQEKIQPLGIVCRIGGDNFVALFLKEQLDTVINYLNGSNLSYTDRGQNIFVSAYTGYYMIPKGCTSATDIMDCVSSAFHLAKDVLQVPYMFFDESVMEIKTKEKQLESIFPDAIQNEEFQVYYQPKVLLKDYSIVGAEALCRWFHDGTLIPPNECIPVLEKSNAVCKLDFYMLEHVCMDIRRWLKEGKQPVRVSVNFSRRHLGEADLVENILNIVDKYQVPHQYIEIELTETTSMAGFGEVKDIVSKLREAGISTSMDDFGVGYSSLNLIREVPWTVLKIDRSLLPQGDEEDTQKSIMLKHLISMLQDMGLECIIEGVETVGQVKLLKENNCYFAQGFYFDRPLPVEVFEERL